MKPAPFSYHRPTSVEQTLALLAEVGGDGKLLAGGQSLLPMLSMRLVAPAHLVDLNAVPGLDTVDAGRHVRVGALVRHSALERHPGAARCQPLLRRALRHVAHPTIRNRGTTVGSIAHADPSGEMPAVLLLLGGHAEVRSARGQRELPAGELFAGPMETTLAPDELLVAVRFPARRPRSGTAVCELARRHGDYAVVGVVAEVELDADGAPASARAAYVSAGRGEVLDLTAAVAGADPSAPGWADAAGEHARDAVVVADDVHAGADYRSHLVAVLTRRALHRAAADAGDDSRHDSRHDSTDGAG